MQDPKVVHGHQEWPPLMSVENEVETGDSPWNDTSKEQVREKFERKNDYE